MKIPLWWDFCVGNATFCLFKYLTNKPPDGANHGNIRIMKKVLWLLGIVLVFASCSLDDESTTFTQELVPIVSVETPDTLVLFQKHTFSITYERPTSCHVFDGYSYEKKQDTLYIGVVNDVYVQNNCEPLTNEEVTTDLNFVPERSGFYVFRFWQGLDEVGDPIYLTKEIPVTME